MTRFNSYPKGFKIAFQSFRMIGLIYLSYLLIALLLAIPFYGLFRSATGNSMLPDSLMAGFDATVIREILHNGGKLFGFYLQSFWPWFFAFLGFQIFLNGGIFSWISNPRGKFSLAQFTRHGRKYFWRFLKLSLYILILNLIIGLIVYVPYALIILTQTGLTDEQIVRPLVLLIGIHLLLLVFIFMLADLTKARIFEQDSRAVLKTMFKCLKVAFKHFFTFYILGILLLLTPLIVFAGYYFLRKAVSVDGSLMILLFLVVQQAVVFLRIFIRTWRLASVYHLHQKIFS